MNELIMLASLAICGLLIAWYLYMWTFRTQDMVIMVKTHEEAKVKQFERMSKMAGGAVKAGMVAARVAKAIKK